MCYKWCSGLSSPFGRGNRMAGFFLDSVDNDLSSLIPVIFHYGEGICGLRGVFGSNDVFLNGQILYNLIVRTLNVSAAIEYPRYIKNNFKYVKIVRHWWCINLFKFFIGTILPLTVWWLRIIKDIRWKLHCKLDCILWYRRCSTTIAHPWEAWMQLSKRKIRYRVTRIVVEMV